MIFRLICFIPYLLIFNFIMYNLMCHDNDINCFNFIIFQKLIVFVYLSLFKINNEIKLCLAYLT